MVSVKIKTPGFCNTTIASVISRKIDVTFSKPNKQRTEKNHSILDWELPFNLNFHYLYRKSNLLGEGSNILLRYDCNLLHA